MWLLSSALSHCKSLPAPPSVNTALYLKHNMHSVSVAVIQLKMYTRHLFKACVTPVLLLQTQHAGPLNSRTLGETGNQRPTLCLNHMQILSSLKGARGLQTVNIPRSLACSSLRLKIFNPGGKQKKKKIKEHTSDRGLSRSNSARNGSRRFNLIRARRGAMETVTYASI